MAWLPAAGAPAQPMLARLLRQRFVRFVLVGGVNTAFGYGAYAALLWAGLSYPLASLLALLLGMAFSFTTQGALVFRHASARALLRYVLAWCGLYGLNVALIGLLVRTGLSAYAAGALATVPVTLASYFLMKHWVFAQRPGH